MMEIQFQKKQVIQNTVLSQFMKKTPTGG